MARSPERRYCTKWDPDPDIGPDHFERLTCRTCLRVGEAGDVNHRPPPPRARPASKPLPAALAAAARARDAAILGERED
ncbi:hypothetical protein C1I95_20400 [Micromonospora craterilacus]|uniref:Uncharacterized protein n=1 Tax=Micromonospora craterilacus TaxID=1655439 RepID=A0A2W2DYB3_9ACTN|nr:hypothetical protein [Micromonospora craterilacus]PZG15071.1 hypothetical protein C1I95_20400 [Micromonospora craterilacus]